MITVNKAEVKFEGNTPLIVTELNRLFEVIFKNIKKEIALKMVSLAIGDALSDNNIDFDDFFDAVENNSKDFDKFKNSDEIKELDKLIFFGIAKLAKELCIDLDKDDSDD